MKNKTKSKQYEYDRVYLKPTHQIILNLQCKKINEE